MTLRALWTLGALDALRTLQALGTATASRTCGTCRASGTLTALDTGVALTAMIEHEDVYGNTHEPRDAQDDDEQQGLLHLTIRAPTAQRDLRRRVLGYWQIVCGRWRRLIAIVLDCREAFDHRGTVGYRLADTHVYLYAAPYQYAKSQP